MEEAEKNKWMCKIYRTNWGNMYFFSWLFVVLLRWFFVEIEDSFPEESTSEVIGHREGGIGTMIIDDDGWWSCWWWWRIWGSWRDRMDRVDRERRHRSVCIERWSTTEWRVSRLIRIHFAPLRPFSRERSPEVIGNFLLSRWCRWGDRWHGSTNGCVGLRDMMINDHWWSDWNECGRCWRIKRCWLESQIERTFLRCRNADPIGFSGRGGLIQLFFLVLIIQRYHVSGVSETDYIDVRIFRSLNRCRHIMK